MSDNGWEQYQKLVLSKLGSLEEDVRNVKDELHAFKLEMTKDIIALKLKASIAGGLIGFLASLAAVFIERKLF